jgi:hypothetical protein
MAEKVRTGSRATEGGGLRVAAVQMDANPAPTADRLARAERLVIQAAESGAQLVVLPELFNTGYSYQAENHARAETADGPTATWKREIAGRLGVHLAGSLMLLDGGEVTSALLLLAPDGRRWRYDKNYPWGWERGFFREPRTRPAVTVAKTELGAIGMLICWDAGHPRLWELYAGRVDLMVICSSPPDVGHAVYRFPDGSQITVEEFGPRVASIRDSTQAVFDEMIDQQTAWLGVPAVNTVGCGEIRTPVPQGVVSLLGYAIGAPWLLKHLAQANQMEMVCGMVHQCKVVAGDGRVLTRLTKEDGESFTLAEVQLSEPRPVPRGPQPPSPIPGLAYFISDHYLPAIVKPVYRKGRRQCRDAQSHR